MVKFKRDLINCILIAIGLNFTSIQKFLNLNITTKVPSNTPTISAVITTYNRADTIAESITSIIKQTVAVDQIIVVDDGSTDNTRTIVSELENKHSQWRGDLCYLYQPNQGKSAALNMGLSKATSEWIAFNDSDDVWMPNKIERQLGTLAEYPECKVCFTATTYGKNGKNTTFDLADLSLDSKSGVLEEATHLIVQKATGIMMQTLLVHSSVMNKIGPSDPPMTVSQDTDLLFRLSLASDLCYTNEPLVTLDRDETRSNRLTRRYPISSSYRLQCELLMCAKWRTEVQSADPELKQCLDNRYFSTLSALSNSYLNEDDFEKAEKSAYKAFIESKSFKFGVKWLLFKFAPNLSKKLRG